MVAARRAHRTGRRPRDGGVARGEGRERPRRGTDRRTTTDDRAWHTRIDCAAVPRHPSHHRHARTHRHDLLGSTHERTRQPCRCRASRHPLVFRRRARHTPAADEQRRKMVLPQGARRDPGMPNAEGGPSANDGLTFDSFRAPRSALVMYSRTVKAGIFALAGLNSVATTYYFYYVYFFMQARFGFGRMENLILAASLGFVYTFASIVCGRFAQRRGHFLSLRLGFFIMAAVLAVGSRIDSISGHVAAMIVCTVGMCF